MQNVNNDRKLGETIEKHTSGLQKHYNRVLHGFQKEDIHDFRVEIKKLRALFRLVNTSETTHLLEIPKPIRKFYRFVGNVRNLQLHEQRIRSLRKDLLIEKPVLYLQILSNEEKLEREKAKKMAGHVSFKDFEKNFAGDLPAELAEDMKNKFVQNIKSALTKIFMLPVLHDEAIHDVRKLVKDLMYNHDFLQELVALVLPPGLNNVEAMNDLTNVLGNYHDLCLAVFFLSPVYLHHIEETEEYNMAVELGTHLQMRKENLKTELMNLLLPIKQQLQDEGKT